MYVAIAWDEGKQVITVVGSDSCLLKACKQFTEVQAFQTQNVSHYVIIMLHPHAGLALAWMSHPFCHFIISDKLGFQKKKMGWIYTTGFPFCSLITAPWRLWPSFHQLWNHFVTELGLKSFLTTEWHHFSCCLPLLWGDTISSVSGYDTKYSHKLYIKKIRWGLQVRTWQPTSWFKSCVYG